MKLIVGLGNPGSKYENTRHNIGFKAIDAYASKIKVELNNEKFNGIFYKGDGFILAKPLTFMNLSGDFVQAICSYFKISHKDVLVIYDDMDLSIATLRYRTKGSSGGQNGIKDIIRKMGTDEIPRLKIGIGRPQRTGVDHVMGQWSKTDIEALNLIKAAIVNKIDEFIKG